LLDRSFELRTPLTTVRGNIELLRHEPPLDVSDQVDVLADAKDEVERLIRLVQQLLELARADAGRPVRRESLPIKPLVEEACRQARLLAPQRAIACEVAEVSVLGDRDALKQVLLVLVDNALVHTPSTATIRTNVTATDHWVAIEVADTGPGIEPHLLGKVFECFYRGDVSRSGRERGAGVVNRQGVGPSSKWNARRNKRGRRRHGVHRQAAAHQWDGGGLRRDNYPANITPSSASVPCVISIPAGGKNQNAVVGEK
jgi:signal transduction histidine kinase